MTIERKVCVGTSNVKLTSLTSKAPVSLGEDCFVLVRRQRCILGTVQTL